MCRTRWYLHKKRLRQTSRQLRSCVFIHSQNRRDSISQSLVLAYNQIITVTSYCASWRPKSLEIPAFYSTAYSGVHQRTLRVTDPLRVIPIGDRFCVYGYFRYEGKTVVGPPYLYNGNPFVGKTTSLDGDGPLVVPKNVIRMIFLICSKQQRIIMDCNGKLCIHVRSQGCHIGVHFPRMRSNEVKES